MFEIVRDGTQVIVRFSGDMHAIEKDVFPFTFECGRDWSAHLLAEYINDKLAKKLQAIRKEAYDEGWTDAKAKNKKETWFYSYW